LKRKVSFPSLNLPQRSDSSQIAPEVRLISPSPISHPLFFLKILSLLPFDLSHTLSNETKSGMLMLVMRHHESGCSIQVELRAKGAPVEAAHRSAAWLSGGSGSDSDGLDRINLTKKIDRSRIGLGLIRSRSGSARLECYQFFSGRVSSSYEFRSF
jgi:hypothetical protein